MAKFIPKAKMSKKAAKALAKEKRVTWETSPVTRIVESKKLYNRKRNSFDRSKDYGEGVSFYNLISSIVPVGLMLNPCYLLWQEGSAAFHNRHNALLSHKSAAEFVFWPPETDPRSVDTFCGRA